MALVSFRRIVAFSAVMVGGVVAMATARRAGWLGAGPAARVLAVFGLLLPLFVAMSTRHDAFDDDAYRADRGPAGIGFDLLQLLVVYAVVAAVLSGVAWLATAPWRLQVVVGSVGGYVASFGLYRRRNDAFYASPDWGAPAEEDEGDVA